MIQYILDHITNSFGIDKNRAATIMVTLFVFISGFVIRGVVFWVKASIDRSRTRTMFRSELERIYSDCKDFISVCDKNANSVSFENDRIFDGAKVNVDIILDSIGYITIYRSFFTSVRSYFSLSKLDKLKAFREVWNTIIKINNARDIFVEISELDNKYNKYNEKRNEKLDELRQFWESVMTQSQLASMVSQEISDYLSKVDDIWVTWQSKDDVGRPDIVQQELINPLKELNKEQGNNFVATKMMNIIISVSMYYGYQKEIIDAEQNKFNDLKATFWIHVSQLESGMGQIMNK